MEFPKLSDFKSKRERICVVGLGYVGLPLAVALARKFNVIGFDINEERILELQKHYDKNAEVDTETLKSSTVKFTSSEGAISGSKFIIVAVPTPIDKYKIPDLSPLRSASGIVGRNMTKCSTVVYESTVYPGATEEVCVPILERESGLRYLTEFKVGYSPERVNPGDKKHPVENIVKVVSGCDSETLELLSGIYGSVIKAGTHKAPSIKTAEAAKVIENTQRDLNIALMNELAVIFHRMKIDTGDVLKAAGTKWNFLGFEPGLVGGHCIGVDPYYLTFKAKELGYYPQVILAGRRINDNMGKFIAEKTVKLMIRQGKKILNSKVLIMGFTFKENIKDIRNTRVIDIYNELKEFGVKPYVYDPHADTEEVKRIYGINTLRSVNEESPYDSIIVAVKHAEFLNLNYDFFKNISIGKPIIVDVKRIYKREELSRCILWRL
ncbi:MAG: nucleotide sugar dehydrogenase [Nitrospiraceae bacterium]|nr:nucleotide sugar dehydrogenase [Nitrospiraceae bacterium]